MKDFKPYRINGFEQIKSFYSWVFNNQDKDVNATHVSLYLFLINQNNRANWVEWFKCPYDLGMAGSCIGSRNTYYKVLEELKNWGLIDYQKGINNYKAPKVKLCLFKNEQLTEQVPVPLSEPLSEQVVIPLSEPLSEHIYKLLTDNIKLITDNIESILNFLNDFNVSPKKEKKDLHIQFLEIFNECSGKKIRVFDDKSKRQFEARLKEGFTIEDFKTAIKNCKQDKFHIENKQYLTPEFITRADKLQKYLNAQSKTIIETEYKTSLR